MRVLNFGSLNLDRTYDVAQFVQAKQTISALGFHTFLGGKGFNQSLALSRSGAVVSHIGVVGSDGQIFYDELQASGVDVQFLRRSKTATGHAIIQVNAAGENCILIAAGANGELCHEDIDAVFMTIHEPCIVLVQNETTSVDYIIQSAHEKHCFIVFNPSPFDDSIQMYPLSLIDLFIVNEVEGAQLCHCLEQADILEQMGQMYPAAEVVLTLSGEGAYYQGNNQIHFQPAIKVPVVDTTGAGDTFCGYFITSYLCEQQTVEAALKIAASASALAIGIKGAANSIPLKSEVLKYIGEEQ